MSSIVGLAIGRVPDLITIRNRYRNRYRYRLRAHYQTVSRGARAVSLLSEVPTGLSRPVCAAADVEANGV